MATATTLSGDDLAAVLCWMHALVKQAEDQRDPCAWLNDQLLEVRLATRTTP